MHWNYIKIGLHLFPAYLNFPYLFLSDFTHLSLDISFDIEYIVLPYRKTRTVSPLLHHLGVQRGAQHVRKEPLISAGNLSGISASLLFDWSSRKMDAKRKIDSEFLLAPSGFPQGS